MPALVAARHNRPIPQVALAWLLGVAGVTAPIIGPRTFDQLEGLLGVTELVLADVEPACVGRPPPSRGLSSPPVCVGKSASQMCLLFAAPGESVGQGLLLRDATMLD